MSDRSMQMPPSGTPRPDALCPPLRTGLAGEHDRAGDVVGVGDAHDHRGTVVDAPWEDRPSGVVIGILRTDHAALEFFGELWGREHGAEGVTTGRSDQYGQLRPGGTGTRTY
jgi:hypothetical protein